MIYTWQNTAWDLQTQPVKLALFPLASTEIYPLGLSPSMRTVLVSEVARRVAEQLAAPVYLLPTWPYGTPDCTSGVSGAISLHYHTLWAVVRDVVQALFAHGIDHVAMINHIGDLNSPASIPAGNVIVKTAVRQLNYEMPGLRAIWVQPFSAAGPALRAMLPAAAAGKHGELLEVSILKELQPQAARPVAGEVPAGIGRQALEAVVAACGEYIERTFRQLDQTNDQHSSNQAGDL